MDSNRKEKENYYNFLSSILPYFLCPSLSFLSLSLQLLIFYLSFLHSNHCSPIFITFLLIFSILSCFLYCYYVALYKNLLPTFDYPYWCWYLLPRLTMSRVRIPPLVLVDEKYKKDLLFQYPFLLQLLILPYFLLLSLSLFNSTWIKTLF